MPRWQHDAGLLTTELVLVVPVIIISFVSLLLFAGRVADAGIHLQATAQRAARAGTMAADGPSAVAEAERVAAANLEPPTIVCAGPSSGVEARIVDPAGGPSGFEPGAVVEVEVTCAVNLADLTLAVVPGQIELEREARELIDVYRSGAD